MSLLFSKEVPVQADGFNYSVSPKIPDNQIGDINSYYNLRMQPSQKTDIQLSITNHFNKVQQFNIKVNTATTNGNGIVDYSENSFNKDKSMTYSIQDLITIKQPLITIEAGATQVVSMTLQMPDQEFDGILLGGITVEPISKQSEKRGISNIYTHTIAIQVSENDNTVSTKLIGNEVQLDQINYHNVVKMNIQNPTARLLKNLKAELTITRKNQNKPIVSMTKKDLSIAPNSNFYLPIEINDTFKPGQYTYTIIMQNEGGEWKFNKDFTIEDKEAKKLNKESVDQQDQRSLNWIIVAGIYIIILVFLWFVYIDNRNKKSLNTDDDNL